MAYDEELAARIRGALLRRRDITEKRMFGGIAFMHRGNMLCGVVDDALMLRLGKEGAREALGEPHTRPMDFTGRVITTMLFVDAPGIESEQALGAWIERALAFTKTLPPK